jgi:predicted transcriptional regulator
MTTLEIVAKALLWSMGVFMGAIAALTLLMSLLPGPRRDDRDDDRVLRAYMEAWDLPIHEISETVRLGFDRTRSAVQRLESKGFLEGYWHDVSKTGRSRRQRYVLTDRGREAVYDLERAKLDEIHSDRHGA